MQSTATSVRNQGSGDSSTWRGMWWSCSKSQWGQPPHHANSDTNSARQHATTPLFARDSAPAVSESRVGEYRGALRMVHAWLSPPSRLRADAVYPTGATGLGRAL